MILPRLWCYISHVLTYLLTYKLWLSSIQNYTIIVIHRLQFIRPPDTVVGAIRLYSVSTNTHCTINALQYSLNFTILQKNLNVSVPFISRIL